MFTDYRHEFSIYRTLRAMSQQRLGDREGRARQREPIDSSGAAGDLTPTGEFPKGPLLTKSKALYRLTDSGWNHIYRANSIALFGAFLAAVGIHLAWK